MAIPPPHAFINIAQARCLPGGTLELDFDHPECAQPDVLFVELFYDGPSPEPGVARLALGLFERRRDHGLAKCTGPVGRQRLYVSLAPLLPDPSIRRGAVVINDDHLYGHYRQLPRFELAFELEDGPAVDPIAEELPVAAPRDPQDARLQAIDALLSQLIATDENQQWGWLPLPRPRWQLAFRPLRADAPHRIDAGGLKADRVLGCIELDMAAGTVTLVRYSYYGFEEVTVMHPDAAWWETAKQIDWPG